MSTDTCCGQDHNSDHRLQRQQYGKGADKHHNDLYRKGIDRILALYQPFNVTFFHSKTLLLSFFLLIIHHFTGYFQSHFPA